MFLWYVGVDVKRRLGTYAAKNVTNRALKRGSYPVQWYLRFGGTSVSAKDVFGISQTTALEARVSVCTYRYVRGERSALCRFVSTHTSYPQYQDRPKRTGVYPFRWRNERKTSF